MILHQLFRYFRILRQLMVTGFIADLQFRANFVVRFFTDLIWYSSQFIFFEVVTGHTSHIGSLSRYELRVFVGVICLVDSLCMIFVHENIDELPTKVRKGDLDLLLSKPVDSLWMVSFNRINTSMFVNFILGVGWTAWAVSQLPIVNEVADGAFQGGHFEFLNLVPFLFAVLVGATVTYCMRMILASLSLIFTNSENLTYIFWQSYRLATRPNSLYSRPLQWLLMTALPFGLIASVPTDILLGKAGGEMLLLTLAVAVFFVGLTHWFWNFCMRWYTSASS